MMKVLYADDERCMLEVGKEFLEKSGKLSVETAVSAKEGLSKMSEEHFDAIISDYQMPEMDGLEFLRSVRDGDHQIPFILFTVRNRGEVVIDTGEDEMISYLQKGGDPTKTFAELEHQIERLVIKQTLERTSNDKGPSESSLDENDREGSWNFEKEAKVLTVDDLLSRS